MHNMLDLSMVYFPYVVMGAGQAVIAATSVTGKKTNNTEELQGRGIARLAFDIAASSEKVRSIPGHPIGSPNWGKA